MKATPVGNGIDHLIQLPTLGENQISLDSYQLQKIKKAAKMIIPLRWILPSLTDSAARDKVHLKLIRQRMTGIYFWW